MVQRAEMPLRRLMAVGNWKMHKTVALAVSDAGELSRQVADLNGLDVLIAPSFTALQPVGQVLQGTRLRFAAQDLHWEDQGAYTGEVSPSQLTDVGCTAVLIGHSERRRYFAETDETVSRKTQAAVRHGLVPVVCVGETLEQRNAGQTASLLESQIEKGLNGVSGEQAASIVIAYEPVWAIGTGQVAAPKQVAESHGLIRKRLSVILDKEACQIPILYGGSVTPENIQELVAIEELGGVLVGGASLEVDKFMKIIRTLAVRAEGR